MQLREPKAVPITTQDGKTKTFIFSKFPAIQGREIFAKYPTSNIPKLGDYGVSEETMLKVMAFVGVEQEPGKPELLLINRTLIDNHVPDWETLVKIEAGMLEYNASFFGNGKSLDIFANIAATLKAWITETLTDSLGQLSRTEKRRSKNSARSTR